MTTHPSLASLMFGSLLLASCSHEPAGGVDCPKTVGSQVTASAASSASAKPGDDALPRDYLELFDRVTAKIDKYHVFAESKKAGWASDKAKLRKEFELVHSRQEALQALWHLQSAIGDRHCHLTQPTDLQPRLYSLGLKVFAEQVGKEEVVRVDEVLDPDLTHEPAAIAVGDQIVAVDSVPIAEWLAQHPFESNSLNPHTARLEQVTAITEAISTWTTVKLDDKRVLRLRRGAVERDVTLTFVRPRKWEDAKPGVSFDDSPDMKTIACRQDKIPLYEDFDLSAVGNSLCIYKPKNGKKDTRLVRYITFHYAPPSGEDGDALRIARADHDLLERELKGSKAVILDLHENYGGNNMYVFMSWFAHKPFEHPLEHVVVSKDFSEDEVRKFLFGEAVVVDNYHAALARGDAEVTYPFTCMKDGKRVFDGTCPPDGPRPSELVTTAPVAIVSGPKCTSSCDEFVTDWSLFGLGPVVGGQPGHGFTGERYEFPLVGPDGRDLGTFRIALSWSNHPPSTTPDEGAPIKMDWEVPDTFDTRKTWVDLSVKEARRRVEATH